MLVIPLLVAEVTLGLPLLDEVSIDGSSVLSKTVFTGFSSTSISSEVKPAVADLFSLSTLTSEISDSCLSMMVSLACKLLDTSEKSEDSSTIST